MQLGSAYANYGSAYASAYASYTASLRDSQQLLNAEQPQQQEQKQAGGKGKDKVNGNNSGNGSAAEVAGGPSVKEKRKPSLRKKWNSYRKKE